MGNPFHWLVKDALLKTDDFYEQSKIKMAFRIWYILFALFVVLAILLLSFEDDLGLIYPVSSGVLALVIVGYFIKTDQIRVASYIISFGGLLIVLLGVFLIDNPMPLDGGLWLLIFCMYAYFSLGKNVGNILFTISLVFYCFYLVWVMPYDLETFELSKYEPQNAAVLVSVIVVIFLIIRHLIIEFIRTKDEAEKHLKEVNCELVYQNSIIDSQNKEKTLMMKEIHHRVKNNLQVINSLLRIQSSKLKDSKTKEVFNEAQNRVIAMALIHEEMYKNNSLDKIDIKNYVNSLAKEIVANNQSTKSVEVLVNSEIKFIHNKTMVPLGLIINELIINSIKHGFPTSSRECIISINFVCDSKSEDICDESIMIYKDNGIGFDASKIDSDLTFGMEMIEALSEQLEGEFKIAKAEMGVEMFLKFSCLILE